MRFQGRIALITAGGRGIGRATAEIIGREGGTVVLVDTDKAALDEAAGAIRKGGIIALTRKLSLELGPFGINVNAIAPSLTLSPRLRPRWDGMSPIEQKAEVERVPLRRIADPEDQARVICFLASSDADFVTGVTIDVTGGQ